MTVQYNINAWRNEVEVILNKMQELPNFPKGRTGGYLAATEIASDELVCLVRAGKILTGNGKAYEKYAPEKTHRLHLMHHSCGHFSSFQSENEALNMYAGAIKTDYLYIGFSGLTPALADEALCLIFSIERELISRGGADNIAAISDNKFYRDYLSMFKIIHHS